MAYETVTFSRAAEEDAEDYITASVCLRRAASRSFYNTVTDESAIGAGCDAVGPMGIEWAPDSCLAHDEEFTTFALAVGCNPHSAIDAPLGLHVLAEDLFIDITFSEWGGGGSGAAFAYERTLVGGGACALGAVCSFERACEDGFTGDGFTCIEDVGCDAECGVSELCVGEEGAAVCICPVGYGVVGDVCTQLDECAVTGLVDFAYVAGDDPDCITDSVCIGHPASGGSIWNTLIDVLPRAGCDTTWASGTEWAGGDCASATDFSTFIDAVDCSLPGAVGGATVSTCRRRGRVLRNYAD